METNWKRALVPLCFMLLGTLSACTGGGTVEAGHSELPSSVSPTEQQFMTKSQQAELAEIDMARSALKTSENSEVRAFATMIQADGSESLADLADLMKDKNVPQKPIAVAEVKRDIARMASLTGAEFDREFIDMMVAQLQQAVETFRDESAAAIDADVKKYTDDFLPQLEMHLDKARRLQSKLFNVPGR